MPRFMVPRFVEIRDSLPKTEATMRIQKVKLREDPLNDATWDREAAGIEVPSSYSDVGPVNVASRFSRRAARPSWMSGPPKP